MTQTTLPGDPSPHLDDSGAPIRVDEVAGAEAEAASAEWWEIFEAYEEQRDFIAGSSAMFQLWCAGRGTGKTWGGALKALFLALVNGGRLTDDARALAYCPGAIFGRTASEIDNKIEPYFLEHLRVFKERTGIPLLANYSAKHARFTLHNGAQIYKVSYGRADSLAKARGYTFAWAYIDEIMFADVDSYKAFQIILATLRHPLAREPQLAVTSSPDGYRGVVAHFHEAHERGDPEYFITTATVFDNPYVDDRFRDNLKKGCSPRQWEAEGLGYVLRPTNVVYVDYNPSVHVVDWDWDRTLPWVLMIDWGENWGWTGAAQVVTRLGYSQAGQEFAPGTWIVCREDLMRDGSPAEQRRRINKMLRECRGVLHLAAADKAVRRENNWLRGTLGGEVVEGVRTLPGNDKQRRSWGIGAISYMLNPGEGVPPRLFFARSLSGNMDAAVGTVRGAFGAYSYQRMRLESGELIPSNKPVENTPPTHACDAVRYGIATSMWIEELHGGQPLPYALAHEPSADTTRDAP